MTSVPLHSAEGGPCAVCAEPVQAGASALCNQCAEPYHLVLTNDADGKNCGEVWLNEEFMTLEFGCARCLAQQRGLEPPPAPGAAPAVPRPAQGRVKHTDARARDIVRRKRR